MSYVPSLITVAIVLALLYAGMNLGWRWASRRFLLPCPSWLSWSLEGGFVDWWTATQRTLDRIGMAPGDHILEVGPGPGRLLIPAAARVRPRGAAVGLDVQPGMIERLQQRGAEVENLSVQVGNAESMPFAAESFDIVYMAMVLGEIPHREQAIAECFRVLKPGGRLSITEMAVDPHFQSRATVTRLAKTAGFAEPRIIGRPWSFTGNFRKPISKT
jgi:ubiquinone/menaquinone biosynthesis C-methylase UbiE